MATIERSCIWRGDSRDHWAIRRPVIQSVWRAAAVSLRNRAKAVKWVRTQRLGIAANLKYSLFGGDRVLRNEGAKLLVSTRKGIPRARRDAGFTNRTSLCAVAPVLL
jgi:hypothetical protein